MNSSLKQTDFLCHEEREFLLCKGQTTNKEPERAVQTTVRRTAQAIRTYYLNVKFNRGFSNVISCHWFIRIFVQVRKITFLYSLNIAKQLDAFGINL